MFPCVEPGHPADFDYWAQLGNYGWSYEEVLPFFKKLEDTRIPGLDKGYFSCSWTISNMLI